MSKKITTISLFIFWAVVTAIMTAGLITYQNSKNTLTNSNNNSSSTNSVLTDKTLVSGQKLTLNLTEIQKHNSKNNCWLIINNKVYDFTTYLTSHPGGVGTIVPYCGKDGTVAFDSKGRSGHSSYANSLLAQYYVGDLNQNISTQQIQQNIKSTNTVAPVLKNEDDED